MSWLDRPISAKGHLFISCACLGFAAFLLADQVGMVMIKSIGLGFLVLIGLVGIAEYVKGKKQ